MHLSWTRSLIPREKATYLSYPVSDLQGGCPVIVTKARGIANLRVKTRKWRQMGPRRRSCSQNHRAVSALYYSPGSLSKCFFCSHSRCGDRLSATSPQLDWRLSSYGPRKNLPTNISLVYLQHSFGIASPYLTIVPKSTIQNWSREFNQWTPDVNIVVLTDPTEECAYIITNRLTPQDFEVCILGYEICLIEKPSFKQFSFELYYH
jgi:SNF2-related domain